MGLSARTSDQSGLPLGENYIVLSTSSNNAILLKDPAEVTAYRAANPAQLGQGGGDDFNTEYQMPAES